MKNTLVRAVVASIGLVLVMATEASAQPDLTCQIQAFEDKAHTKQITNGKTLQYGGGGPGVWTVVKVTNAGNQTVGTQEFKVSLLIKRNGGTAVNTSYVVDAVPPLDPGKWKFRPLVPPVGGVYVNYPGTTTKIEITSVADPLQQVAESNEGNNQCKISFVAKVVG